MSGPTIDELLAFYRSKGAKFVSREELAKWFDAEDAAERASAEADPSRGLPSPHPEGVAVLIAAARAFDEVRTRHPFDCRPMWDAANAISAAVAGLTARDKGEQA